MFRSHCKRGKDAQLTAPHHDIEWVTNITALGVVINDRLTASDHVSYTLAGCTSLHYALRILRCHGLPEQSLKNVFQATVIAKLTYCLPAWFGLCSAADRTRLIAFLRRCMKLSYYSTSDPDILSIAEEVEYDLFTTILRNRQLGLQPYLQRPQLHYQLRNRLGLSKSLIQKTDDLNSSSANCIKLSQVKSSSL